MIPRDYQRAAVDAARDRTTTHGNTMLVLPVNRHPNGPPDRRPKGTPLAMW